MADRTRRSGAPSAEMSAVRRALAEPETAPLAAFLPSELDEERVPRMWREVDFRLSGEASRNSHKTFALRALAFAAVLLLGVGGYLWQRHGAGELRAEGQARAPAVLESHATPSVQRFQDGSKVELGPFARLEVLRNDGRSFVTVLRRGKSSFDVQPGGPRHWVIEAGLASVEVVGTRFSVERETAGVHVAVERGVVLVRAESLPGGSVRLTAGQRVEVEAPPIEAATKSGAAAPEPLAPPVPAVAALAPSALPLEHPSAELTSRLAPSAPAASSAAPAGSGSAGPAADEVELALAAADGARQRGDRAAAVAYFEAAIAAAAPMDPRRGIAALSVARLLLQTNPGKAAAVLSRSFAAVPRALQEDAWARRVEAEGRSGNLVEAARLANEYEQRFPNGQRSEEVRRWLGR